jgi:hypothetical protein
MMENTAEWAVFKPQIEGETMGGHPARKKNALKILARVIYLRIENHMERQQQLVDWIQLAQDGYVGWLFWTC